MKPYPVAFWDPVEPAVLEKIHQSTLKVMSQTGLNFHSPAAVEVFKNHGVKVDGLRVYLDEKTVDQTLQSCPRTFTIRARDPQFDVVLGQDMVVATATGALYYITESEGRRLATLADFENIQRLYQTSDIVDMVGYTPVYPSDVPAEIKFLRMTQASLRHTSKPFIIPMSHTQECLDMLQMLQVAFEDSQIYQKACIVGAGITPLNPLQYGAEALDTMMELAKRGQALFLAPAPMMALSSPINHLGTAVQQNAEILAGLALVQLINPGSPVVYMPGSFTGYMKTAGCAVSSPDSYLANAINFQLCRTLYHLPIRANSSLTEAKLLDAQAGAETMLCMLMAMMGGAHLFHISLGCLDSILGFSPEKLILDEEIYSRCAHMMKGPSLQETDYAVDLLAEVGPGGSFITHKSTLKNYKKLWTPTVSHWDTHSHWADNGSTSVAQRAAVIVKERLGRARSDYLSPQADREIESIIAKKL
ncbi:MAG: trimethylamine methyltransferase family protein [Deltaproteobacteria bacterium]|jgi:trimethylamine--corrinoid protein Co-methyltransferase|nr:trimethylamine methyltransferase family protein [Deltaproteobacteria bacterium]